MLGSTRWMAAGTRPDHPGSTGVMPYARIAARMLRCSACCESSQKWSSGPPQVCMLFILHHGRKAAPLIHEKSSASVSPSEESI